MKAKTSELIDIALDWAVGIANGGLYQSASARDAFWIWPGEPVKYSKASPAYSTDWAQGGPIIDREKIGFNWVVSNYLHVTGCWSAYIPQTNGKILYGPTPLIAAMRCYVASKLGDELEIPEELT